ncbi:hypothetical protein M885DRAFT_433127 [Pelagophyceae sp. CCMP2097]|nr:hypothetical protein M885DRAFT_433127 [Pelagophyceae sp. CCMP2097]
MAGLNAEKPVETGCAPEAVTLWKICTAEDLAAWEASGRIDGSALDLRDGFHHYSNAVMVKKVAAMFFAGKSAKLLCIQPEHMPAATVWVDKATSDEALRLRLPAQAQACVRLLMPDGCAHVHARAPWPMACVSATYDVPYDADAKVHRFPTDCVLREGPRGQSFGGITFNY